MTVRAYIENNTLLLGIQLWQMKRNFY